MTLAAGEYLEGLAFLLLHLGACVAAGVICVARGLHWLTGAPRALAAFTVTTACLTASLLVPGMLGVLSRPAALAVALALAGLAAVLVRGRTPETVSPVAEAPGRAPRWTQIAAGLAVGAVAVAATGFLVARSRFPVTGVDALTVHLPAVARFLESGSLWQIVQYGSDLSNGTYPQNGTLMELALVLPWDSTFLVRFAGLPFVVAAAVAVYALGRELGAPKAESALAAALVPAIPAVALPGLDQAQVDAPMLAWFAIACLFLLRHARGGPRAELVIGAVSLGLAFGTKWYAVPYAVVVGIAWLVARRRARRSETGREAALLSGLVAAAGGFWLVRNWVETSNPVHPAPVAPLGVTIFDAPADPVREAGGHTVWDYLANLDVWREHLLPAYRDHLGAAGALLLLAIVVAGVLAWRRREGAPAAVALVSLVLAALYVKLPDTAFGPPGNPVLVGPNARYLVPALIGGAPLLAWLAAHSGRLRPAIIALALAALALTLPEAFPATGARDLAAGAVLSAGLATVALFVARSRTFPLLRGPMPGAAAGAIAVVVVVAAAGWELRDRSAAHPYGSADPVVAGLEHVAPGAAVALGKKWAPRGVSPVLPAFGPRLENRVDYLGTFVDGTLRQHARRGPFQRQLELGEYAAVVIGRGAPPRAGGEQPEAGWLLSAGYRETARSPRLVLFKR